MGRVKSAGTPTAKSAPADNGAEFHQHFSAQYLARYPGLFEALALPVQHVALVNGFANSNTCADLGLKSLEASECVTLYRYSQPPPSYLPPPTDLPTGLKQHYWLDLASVLPAVLLDVQHQHVVLDMCAAPGGKSLILAHCLLRPSHQQAPRQGPALSALKAVPLQQPVKQPPGTEQPVQYAEDTQQERGPGLPQQQQQQHPSPEAPQEPVDLQEDVAISRAGSTTEPGVSQAGAVPADGQPAEPGQPQTTQCNTSNLAGPPLANPAAALRQDGGSSTSDDDGANECLIRGGNEPRVGRLVCNEVDPGRRSRLQSVLQQYLPAPVRRHVRITGHDATRHWGTYEERLYDRVLLDAPCSSDRHVVGAAMAGGGVIAGSSWSLRRVKQLAQLQLQLLLAGLRCLKPGGQLVYSTCSISTLQNDDVVRAAVAQHNQAVAPARRCCDEVGTSHDGVGLPCPVPVGSVEASQLGLQAGAVFVVPPADVVVSVGLAQALGLESTSLGMISLPDKGGHGPIYAAVMQKVA